MSNKFLTVIYDMSRPGMQQKASLLLLEADWTASGWSHAFADRDEARAELIRLQQFIAAAPQVVADEADLECQVPPFGWRCTRGAGHPGPCAAVECPEDVAAVERGMTRLAAAPVQAQEPVNSTMTNKEIELAISLGKAQGTLRFIATVSKDKYLAQKALDAATASPEVAPVQPLAVPDEEEFGFKAVRLRRTAFSLGLEGAIPDNDKDLMDCMGVVLGMICREVEQRSAAPAAQGDALADAYQRREAYYAHTGNSTIDYGGREWGDFIGGWDAAIAAKAAS